MIEPTPYSALPARCFWRSAVAEMGPFALQELWTSKWSLPQDARFATYGSCFAQHIAQALRLRGMGWIDAEPAPAGTPRGLARNYNYSIFSARTANVYTAAQLLLLLGMAAEDIPHDAAEVWEDGGRFRDSLRPGIEPDGFASQAEVMASRYSMLRSLRQSIEKADVFVFTLGLTEGWQNREGQPLAACPGTMGGRFEAASHHFVNYHYAEIRADLEASLALLLRINPAIHLLLTVSPVPLTATASGHHVLVASSYSKSVLRAVAGDLAEARAAVDYFPSYEVITGQPSRHGFYAPNLREVVPQGVELVMGHFFNGLRLTAPPKHFGEAAAWALSQTAEAAALHHEALLCDEAALEAYNAH